jgi:hypothetical protein
MKSLLFISEDKEKALIQEMTYRIQVSGIDIHPSDTCFLMVSPDYSAIVTQHLSHALSMNQEIFHIESVNVPFPNEDVTEYLQEFIENYSKWEKRWKKFVLIEVGVIRGGNYSWITDIIKQKYYTIALCENIHSKYKSDFVSLYYNDMKEDLHFWWEKPNNHWKFENK